MNAIATAKRKQEIVDYLEANGYVRSKRSLQSWINPDEPNKRFKFGQLVLRKEVKNTLKEWKSIGSSYIRYVRITEDGLTGFVTIKKEK
jgi:DNA-binding transcriptional regulator YhcF (GntR family)